MKCKNLLFVLLFLCIGNMVQGQSARDTATKIITISNKGAKDCLYQHGLIWLLSTNGILYVIEEKSYSIKKTFAFRTKIVALTKDTANNIVIADSIGTISLISNNFDTSVLLYNLGIEILRIVINKENSMFLITNQGIYIPDEGRLYYENAYSNPMVEKRNFYEWSPSDICVDDQQNIWLSFAAGEWGGDIIIFSTWEKRFIRLRDMQKYRHPAAVRSMFRIDTSFYVSTSLSHMGYTAGGIMKISPPGNDVFESDKYSDTIQNTYRDQPLYIGPATYNEKDSCIYFYCQFGVFKGHIKKDLTRLENWNHLFETNLSWRYGQPDAVGYSMNVSRMFAAGNKLFLVSPGNGVLMWDGKEKVLIK